MKKTSEKEQFCKKCFRELINCICKEKEFDLSEKIICMKHSYKTCKWAYLEEDVKEFIKRLKEDVWFVADGFRSGGCEEQACKSAIITTIDKLAGEKLK